MDDGELDVGCDDLRVWKLGCQCIARADIDVDPVPVHILACDLDRDRIDVERNDRGEAGPCGGNRDHAGAAPRVENASAWKSGEELEYQPLRGAIRHGPRPPRLPRVY